MINSEQVQEWVDDSSLIVDGQQQKIKGESLKISIRSDIDGREWIIECIITQLGKMDKTCKMIHRML